MKTKLIAIAATLVVAGCVEVDPNYKDNDGWVEKTYRTGSNIPTKTSPQADGVNVMSKDDYDRWRIESAPSIPCSPHLGCGSGGSH